MKRNLTIPIAVLLISISLSKGQTPNSMIRHTVVFKLKHSKGSLEEINFFAAAKKLASIPGVEKFESLQEVSPKNKFEYGLSMEFANQDLYDAYTKHSAHVNFVKTYWSEVEDFLEIDYKIIN